MRVNSTDIQNAFGRYLTLSEKEDIIITKNGKNIAKLVSYREPEEFIINEAKGVYSTRKRISYGEYENIVKISDQRYELINGEIYLQASPSFKHQVILGEVFGYLRDLFRDHSCRVLSAPLDVHLKGYAEKFTEDPNVVQPDLMIICDEENVSEEGKYEGVPTLVVEIISPPTRSKDMITKLDLYMRSGIREYWIIDPDKKQLWQYQFNVERELESTNLFSNTEKVESAVFAELSINLAIIF